MQQTHTRGASIDVDDSRLLKKLKTKHTQEALDPSSSFADSLLDDATVNRLSTSYRESKPYLHAVVDKLFQDDLLSKVKDECLGELSFTEKETDIYKVSSKNIEVLSSLISVPGYCRFIRQAI